MLMKISNSKTISVENVRKPALTIYAYPRSHVWGYSCYGYFPYKLFIQLAINKYLFGCVQFSRWRENKQQSFSKNSLTLIFRWTLIGRLDTFISGSAIQFCLGFRIFFFFIYENLRATERNAATFPLNYITHRLWTCANFRMMYTRV